MRPYSLILDLLAHDGGGVRQRIGMFSVLIADVGFISVLGRHNLRGSDQTGDPFKREPGHEARK